MPAHLPPRVQDDHGADHGHEKEHHVNKVKNIQVRVCSSEEGEGEAGKETGDTNLAVLSAYPALIGTGSLSRNSAAGVFDHA